MRKQCNKSRLLHRIDRLGQDACRHGVLDTCTAIAPRLPPEQLRMDRFGGCRR
jgi:hypothetical protein